MGKYEDEYKLLNKRQKEAVEAVEGPVLVVAGPGTGKTQLLSMRVANIMKQTDTDAASILCLTFTNKAATNMRERLNQLVGPASRYVVVRTFHSFAAELMNNYPDYFWSGARLSVAPDAVQLEIIQGILASLPLDNPLASTFAGAFTALSDVQTGLKLAKEAGLTPDELREIINDNNGYIDKIESKLVDILSPPLNAKSLDSLSVKIDRLPEQKLPVGSLLLPMSRVIKEGLEHALKEDAGTAKTTNTGKWKKAWVQTVDGQKSMNDERKRNAWWLALAEIYEAYREQLHNRGYYDYSDMLIEVLQQLEQKPEMRADVQERFLYVLIDEFQDTNAAQLRLAHLVSDHYAANDRPNLMAVGDDDQSIFAFNGAELNNSLNFRRSYPDTKLIVLEDNYRSSQTVLDSAKTIIEQAEDRLVKREKDITKELVAQNAPKAKSHVGHISYPTRQHQQLAIAKRIKEEWGQGKGDRTIAVLARQHDSLKQLAGILLRDNLPVRYEQQSNVLKHEAVEVICLMATLAVDIAGGNKSSVNASLARLIRHPMWQISPKTLWKLAISNYSSPDWLDSLLSHDDKDLNNVGNWLVWLARSAESQPLTVSLEYALGLTEGEYLLSPFKDYYLKKQPLTSEYLETLSAVELLRNLAQEFAGQTEANLADFVRFVELNLSTNRVIADESWFMSSDKAVQLLTIHKAKGLEFDSVYVIDATEKMWQPRAGRKKSPANLQLQAYGENYDDYVRLLYVAASRAKSALTFTSFKFSDTGEEILPTPLLSAIPVESIEEPAQEPIDVLEGDIRWPRLKTNDEKALLSDRIEKLSLSPTSFIEFLDVAEAGPDSFFERQLLKLPRVRDAKGSYGTAIHAALETAQRLINTTGLEFGTVLDRFEAALTEEHLAPLEFERYCNLGEGLLKRLLQEKRLILEKGGLPEQMLRDVTVGKARVGGKIDRLDKREGSLLISDYKTGKPLTSFETKDKTKAVKAWRHKTQLLFYMLMAQNSSRYKGASQVEAQMLYVEADRLSDTSLVIKAEKDELVRLEALIQAVWAKVTGLQFPDTSKYPKDIEGIRQFEQDLIDGKL